jgi:pseudouridine-5'-phosphate glycosidase
MDISADLIELGQTPVCVVCAGVKSILDIPKTLEVLETNGVPVVSFNSDIFPAFFTNDSGVKSPLNLTSTTTIAEMMMNAEILGLNHGFVIGVPNPKPAETEETQKAINTALQLAAEQGITGAALTPFILQHIEKLTHGKSLEANISLVLNNAIIASKIAKDYLNIKSGLSRPPPAPFRYRIAQVLTL